ncbi:O-acetyl-ADP-ribose deacetylase [Corynebacterium comes]|nr:O-acetyl-ADP-ribose deacetylase [Corynebacterium comes]
MKISVEPGDITTIRVDAVVNAANSELRVGGGVDAAIHCVGGPTILAETRRIRIDQYPDGLPAGRAVATTAGNLPARWVIHTVGPVYSTREDRSHVLESCYRESLLLAASLGARSVAFPAISAGVYGWPINDAARIAVSTADGLAEEVGRVVREVIFVPFGEAASAAFAWALADLDRLRKG